MIPKQDNSGNEFQNMINDMRKQFSSGNSIGDMKDSFAKSSGDIVTEIDVLIGVEQKNAKNMVNTMSDGMEDVMINLGKFGTHKIVDLNKHMLKQGDHQSGLLKQIRAGFGGRTGLLGTIKGFLLSFKPFSAERQARIRKKQNIAINKIVRLTWMEQIKTNDILKEAHKKKQKTSGKGKKKEEEQEKRAWWLKLFRDPDNFGRRDKADLKGDGRWGPIKKLFPLLGLLLSGGLAIAIGMLVENLTRWSASAGWLKKLKFVIDFNILRVQEAFETIIKSKRFKAIASKFTKFLKLIEDTFPVAEKFFDFVKLIFAKTKLVFVNAWKTIKWIKKAVTPIFKVLKAIFVGAGKAMSFAGLWIGKIIKFLPFIGKFVSAFGKFIPFVNIAFALFDVFRGMFKGVEEIGGLKGAITGMIGGLLEFITFGIFDIGKFLETAKAAFAKFKDGDWVGGILGLIKAPIDGLSSGIKWLAGWLMNKLGLTEEGAKAQKDGGLFSQIMYWALMPHRMVIKGIMWIVDKIAWVIQEVKDIFMAHVMGTGIISKIKGFFVTLGEIFGDIIHHPIKTIRAMISGDYKTKEGTRQEANSVLAAGRKFGTDKLSTTAASLIYRGMTKDDAMRTATQASFEEQKTLLLARNARQEAEAAQMARASQMTPSQQQGAGNARPTLILNDASFRAAEYHMNKVYNPHHD